MKNKECTKIRCKYLRAIKLYLEDVWFDVSYFYNYSIKHPILGVKIGMENFWKYKSIIYRDRWWDYSFTMQLLQFKLKDTIDNWTEKNTHSVGAYFTRKRMIVLLKRLENFEDTLDNLQYDFIVNKKYTKEEYDEARKEVIMKTWLSLGNNIQRFWD